MENAPRNRAHRTPRHRRRFFFALLIVLDHKL